jgi:hypothetical protein
MTEENKKEERPHTDRPEDKGFWCVVARRAAEFWDFIDERDIDKHVTAVTVLTFIIVGTYHVVSWGMDSYSYWVALLQAGKSVPGSDVALVIGAVSAPWTLIVTTVVPFLLSFYFKSRQ